MKLTAYLRSLLLAGGALWGLTLNTPAALLDNLTGYYSFSSPVNGVVPNSARAFGYAGFTNDSAILYTATALPGSVIFPPWTNNATDPTVVRAGNGALSCQAASAGDYAQTTDLPLFSIQDDWTISVWFKPNTAGTGLFNTGTRDFVIETAGTTAPISFGIRGTTLTDSNGVGQCDFQFYSMLVDGTSPSVDYYVPTNQVDQWHHLVIDYDAEDVSLVTNEFGMMNGYIDGQLVCQLAPTDLFVLYGGFNFGTYRSANGRWWNGQIDEAAMWERLLTTNEIAALYQAGTNEETVGSLVNSETSLTNELVAYWNFDGSYGPTNSWVVTNQAVAIGGIPTYDTGPANLTLYGGEYGAGTLYTYPMSTNAAQVSVPGDAALLGNGTNNYVHILGNPLDPQKDLTVSAWFLPNTGGTGYAGTSTRAFVFETSDPTATYAPISFGIRGTAVQNPSWPYVNAGYTNPVPTCDFQWYGMFNDSTKPYADTWVPATLSDQWHHVVQIYHCVSGGLTGSNSAPYTNEMQCWLDGVNTTNQYYTKTNVSLSLIQGFNLGTYRAASARWFNGSIDEVAMWQRALSSNEIVALYTNGLAGYSVLSYAPPQILSLTPDPTAGGYSLSWQGLSGHQYGVQVSTNLINWSAPIVTGFTASSAKPAITISATPGSTGFYDPGLTNGGPRFYRVVLQQ
jgi:hypothetical protein